MGAFRDIAGQRFGRYTALRHIGMNKRGRAIWEVRCDCGTVSTALSNSLVTGHTQSCGCHRLDRLRETIRTHGEAPRSGSTNEYRTWRQMRTRCENPADKGYENYGGRGISICAGWASFNAFLADMGRKPTAAHSIDRIDNEQGYQCGRCAECVARGAAANCRWATVKEQQRNKRSNKLVRCGDADLALVAACEQVGIKYMTAVMRMRRGWSPEEAVHTPVGQVPASRRDRSGSRPVRGAEESHG
ncbi:MAG: hypothetical protein WKG00_14950 [Polyangiaceae bacterium]